MNILQSAAPSAALQGFVRAYAQRTSGAAEMDCVQPVPASLEVVLGFEFGALPRVDYRNGTSESAHRIALVGPHTRPDATLTVSAEVESFAVFLQPTALQSVLGIPTHLLVDCSYPAAHVLGSGVELLWSVLAEANSFGERVRLVERYLLSQLQVAELTTVCHVAMDTFHGHGQLEVRQMAASASLSVRQFERQFKTELGMPPKLFARIARFQFALDAKLVNPHRSWLEVAHVSAYYDQMHLVRDFQHLAGASPSHLMLQLGDTRPPALAEAVTSASPRRVSA